ncbi:MAG TPA: ABC-F family ATP-binding cassette domain-containing protein [Syntrophomonadaceae bacterium]|nr:ABC-F family ATP-binding cassette domain-containing protein [Syntrophomonadaceae bacterium]
MLLFSVEEAAQSLGGKDIFTGVSFEVHSGEKLAIVGPNGVGKSTLLRIIAGLDQPCEGRTKYYVPINCGLLSQHFDVEKSYTIGETLERSVPEDGFHRSVGEALSKFQFASQEGQQVAKLSGGEKTRLQLACIWLAGAQLLLLDEPTNHLDAANLDWLEGFICDSPDTIVLVSHDRYFLDRTVTRVLELRTDGMNSYPGNYSAYHKAKLDKLAQDKKTYLDQENQARKLDEAIREQKNWAGQAHDRSARKAIEVGLKMGGKEYYRTKAKKLDRRVKNNIKRLERLEKDRIARPPTTRIMDLSFTGGTRAKNGILQAEGIAKAFGRRVLFADSKVSLRYGEKVGLVGMNGSGKTTFLRIIAGYESLDTGGLWISPSLRLGYLDQEMQNLDKNRTVLEEVVSVCPDRGRVRNLLADLLLTGQDVFKPCLVLSMGERVRVALAKLLLGTFDLLLMDEPTNYLDLESREKLEEALELFPGSLIIVSHDRYLMDRVVENVWSIEDGHIQVYPGGYHEYVEKRCLGQTKQPEKQIDRLELEIRKARIISDLSIIDPVRNKDEYLRLEQEYMQIIQQLREL